MGDSIIHKTGFRRKHLFTDSQYEMLVDNGMTHVQDHDAVPCVYLKANNATFLLSEICDDKPDMAYGLYYDDNGKPVLGYVSLEFLYDYHENKEFLVNDITYIAGKDPISVFKKVADEFGKIVPDDELLEETFAKYRII